MSLAKCKDRSASKLLAGLLLNETLETVNKPAMIWNLVMLVFIAAKPYGVVGKYRCTAS